MGRARLAAGARPTAERREDLQEPAPVGPVLHHHRGKLLLGHRGEMQVDDAAVALRVDALDEPRLLRARDELGDAGLRQLEPVGDLGDGAGVTPWERAISSLRRA